MSAPRRHPVRYCPTCQKKAWATRGDARQHARATYPGDHQRPYRCPVGNGYHHGHLPRPVLQGTERIDLWANGQRARARRTPPQVLEAIHAVHAASERTRPRLT